MFYYFNFDKNVIKKIEKQENHPFKKLICISFLNEFDEMCYEDIKKENIFECKDYFTAMREFLKNKIDKMDENEMVCLYNQIGEY